MYAELKGKRAVAGIRVSTSKQQKQGDSPEDQREQIDTFAANNGIEVVERLAYAESAAKEIQPMQQLIDYCKRSKGGVEVVIVKSIDRFTRGGADTYLALKAQLEALNIQLIDIYGIIDTRVVNTLEHLGVSYKWSRNAPSRKLEIMEAERYRDEVSQILTRIIGAEIRFTQLGYWMRAAPYGYKGIKQNTPHGKRTILVPDEDEQFYIKKIFELKAQKTLSDTEICKKINELGFKSRVQYRHDKNDPSKILKQVGGGPITPNNIHYYYEKLIYAGIILESWTHGQAIKGQIKPIVSIDLWNEVNKGKRKIIQTSIGVVVENDDRPKAKLPEYIREDLYQFRKFVLCPICKKPFIGSASRGKSGKVYPAYHCRRDGHAYRVPKQEFEDTIRDFLRSLQPDSGQVAEIRSLMMSLFDKEHLSSAEEEMVAAKRLDELNEQLRSLARKITMMDSPTAIKYMEEEMDKTQAEVEQLESVKTEPRIPIETDFEKITNYLIYFFTHLEKLVFDLCKPAQKTAFFNLLFDKTPTYDVIKSHTPKTALPQDVNGLFRVINDSISTVVIPRRIELRLPG